MGILDRLLGRDAPEVDEAFLGLRAQALAFRPGGDGDGEGGTLHGIVMETGRSHGSATLVCLNEGSVSLYFSSGGGLIGAGEHTSVRDACLKLFEWASPFATEFVAAAEPVKDHPLPRKAQVHFYLLSADGVYLARCKEADLVAGRDPFSHLFLACNHVLTQVRLLREQEGATE